ncbi:MAG: hypothetical protein V4858_23215 [Pseudomonadota bacterium]
MNQCSKLLVLALLLVQASHAALIPGVDEYLTASKEFEQQKLEANTRKTMPRIADEQAAAVLEVLSDDRVLSGRKYTVQDMDILFDVCGKANEVNMSYALFDIKNQVTKTNDVATVTAQVQHLMLKNVYMFQDEVAKVQPFLIRCLAKQLPLLTQFLESLRPEEFTDVRRKGALQARNGMLGVYYGALTSVSDQRIKIGNRLRMLTALADTSSVFAQSLSDDLRRAVADLANSASQSAPDVLRKPLLTIQRSMRESSCSVICKL